MKNCLRVISISICIIQIFCLCACNSIIQDNSSSEIDVEYTSEQIYVDNTSSSGNESVSSVESVVSNTHDNTLDNQSQQITSSENSPVSSQVTSSQKNNANTSKIPNVTIFVQAADDIYIIGGVCSKDTEYINISGNGIKELKLTPLKCQSNSSFITQVKINGSTMINIQCKEKGKDISGSVAKFATTNVGMKNIMTATDYTPVFGTDNRMHYYSAILSYTLSDIVNSGIKNIAKQNISTVVDAAKNNGAEVVYLVVPSSAAVYPETLPSEYKKASGETIFSAFNKIATECGAKVIYPIDTMTAHKNDGEGYKIYSHTDSHWTTYGAYFGVSELMNHISVKYPSAKPRTISEMKFYVTELYAGDSLFSFGDNNGFENYSEAMFTGGATQKTGIKEMTTLYNLKMPTDTLSQITRNRKSVYLTKDNESAIDITNPNGNALPSALVMRDSFARTAFDMVNDRFSKVYWQAEGDYNCNFSTLFNQKPNYIIYIVSERNLLKVMFNNKDFAISSMQ